MSEQNFIFRPALKTYSQAPTGPSDPYWDNVSLLLPFEGTSGATTTTDLSTNSTAVTFYGGAQISNTQTKFGSTSLYLDGVDSYLRVDDALSSHTNITTPITIETWIYPLAVVSTQYLVGMNDISNGQNRVLLGLTNINVDGTTYNYTSGITTNAWHHFAYTYDGAAHAVYIDGVKKLQVDDNPVGVSLSNCVMAIGAEFDAANGGSPGNYIQAYIDDFRVTVNHVRYFAYEVPTAGYTLLGDPYASNVVLLSNYDGAFDDESNLNHTLSTTGSTVIGTGPADTWGTGVAYNGSGDGYVLAPELSDEFTFGTGDFTIELRQYRNTISGAQNIIGWAGGSCGLYYAASSSKINILINGTVIDTPNYNYYQLQWHHIVFQRVSGVFSLSVNGKNISNISSAETLGSGDFTVLHRETALYGFKGPIDSVRVTKGVARYPDAVQFDVPTETFPTN